MAIIVARETEWQDQRDRIDLAAVATRLLGPAQGRRGQRGRKLWWPCPFHRDANPSFCVEPGKPWWHCFGCGENGDAASLVMRVGKMSFPEAKTYLTDSDSAARKPIPRPNPVPMPGPKPKADPEGMTHEAAAALVSEAADRLWTPEGKTALAYLTGPTRCLSPETIRAARLGVSFGSEARTKDGRAYTVRGVVVPWWNGRNVTMVKVRQPEGRQPKYAEVFRDRGRHAGIYPGPETIRAGRPLVIVEGEFDALCLGEALGELAAVVTLGSASARPETSILGRMLAAAPWFIATDGDPAGDRSAAGWPVVARRVRPPEPYKDWSEARRGGVDLSRWWRDILAGSDRPRLFTWEDLSAMRWGTGVNDSTPGVENPDGGFTPEIFAHAMTPEADPYSQAEREAIQAEAQPVGGPEHLID